MKMIENSKIEMTKKFKIGDGRILGVFGHENSCWKGQGSVGKWGWKDEREVCQRGQVLVEWEIGPSCQLWSMWHHTRCSDWNLKTTQTEHFWGHSLGIWMKEGHLCLCHCCIVCHENYEVRKIGAKYVEYCRSSWVKKVRQCWVTALCACKYL